MIILYVMFLGIYDDISDELSSDIEMSLEVFESMDTVTVAHRCALLAQQVFEIAKETITERKRSLGSTLVRVASENQQEQQGQHGDGVDQSATTTQTSAFGFQHHSTATDLFSTCGVTYENLHASLLDPDLLNFMESGQVQTWDYDVGFGTTTAGEPIPRGIEDWGF